MTTRKMKLLLAIVVAFLASMWLLRSMVLPIGGSQRFSITIPRGSSAGEVADILVKEKVIRSAFGFRLLARITGKGGDLKPGRYELSPSMAPSAVLKRIAEGRVSARWITFPEGYTIQQMADRLNETGFASGDRFLMIAQSEGRKFTVPFEHPGDSLEGFLFPDTYLIPQDATEEHIVKMMLDCFGHKVVESYGLDIARSGMSLKEVVTLASLIEKEARVPRDRPLIAAVLLNRLRSRMRLGCDATVLYALGKHKSRVLYRDLEIDSPYNTYRNFGLPPGPIASPGLESIEAALHPANVDYLYYVARPDGSHIFSRTFQEHQQAIQNVRRKGAD